MKRVIFACVRNGGRSQIMSLLPPSEASTNSGFAGPSQVTLPSSQRRQKPLKNQIGVHLK